MTNTAYEVYIHLLVKDHLSPATMQKSVLQRKHTLNINDPDMQEHRQKQEQIREGLFLKTDNYAFLTATKQHFGNDNLNEFIEMIVKTLQIKKNQRT